MLLVPRVQGRKEGEHWLRAVSYIPNKLDGGRNVGLRLNYDCCVECRNEIGPSGSPTCRVVDYLELDVFDLHIQGGAIPDISQDESVGIVLDASQYGGSHREFGLPRCFLSQDVSLNGVPDQDGSGKEVDGLAPFPRDPAKGENA